MKNKGLLFVVAAVCSLSLASCINSSYSTTTVRKAETLKSFISEPLVAEYERIETTRVSDTSRYDLFGDNINYNSLKEDAIVKCSKKYGCDILVDVSCDAYKEKHVLTVIVSGYPATFKRLRPATKDDLWMLQFINAGGTIAPVDEVEHK